MSKLKLKLILFLIFTTIGLIVGFFFSQLIDLALSRTFENLGQLSPILIFKSLVSSSRHRLLLFAIDLIIVSLIAVVVLLSKKQSYESDINSITEILKTPIAVGQGQHGTARWLRKQEQQKAFSIYRLDKDDETTNKMIDAGEKDIKELVDYQEKQKKKAIADKQKPDNTGETPPPEIPKVEENETEEVQQ